MVNTTIEFGGFYGSIHEQLIQSAIESYIDTESAEYDLIDWRANFERYIKWYALEFERFILDECGVSVTFSNIELKSPREYNFKTDTIEAAIGKSAEKALILAYKNDPDFVGFLSEATKSYSGFISFYSFHDAISNKDNVFTVYLFRYLAEIFNDTELESRFDITCQYDKVILPESEALNV